MNTDSIRTFIALELPDDLKQGLRSLQTCLKSSDSGMVKWVNPESIHLTLKFLGETRLALIPSIITALEDIAKNTLPFELSVTNLGAFPDIHRVQVIWVGLNGDLRAILQLQKNIEKALSPLGFAAETKVFVPHLTLARMRDTCSLQDRQNIGAVIKRTPFEGSFKLKADSLNLIQSHLTPGGAIYTNLHSAKLNPYCA